MCIHETVQITDENRIIICGDCGREFGHLMRDSRETFIAYVSAEHPTAVLPVAEYDEINDQTEGIGFMVPDEGMMTMAPVYPCGTCQYDSTCPQEGETCHT